MVCKGYEAQHASVLQEQPAVQSSATSTTEAASTLPVKSDSIAYRPAVALEVDAGHDLWVVMLEVCCYCSAHGTSHA
jgi:hypothetical protein